MLPWVDLKQACTIVFHAGIATVGSQGVFRIGGLLLVAFLIVRSRFATTRVEPIGSATLGVERKERGFPIGDMHAPLDVGDVVPNNHLLGRGEAALSVFG